MTTYAESTTIPAALDPAGVRGAAVAALAAHDALLASQAREPFVAYRDGLPVDSARWVQWYELGFKPSYDVWSAAMDRLAEAMGAAGLVFPGRHPWSFRPVCEAIITGAAGAVASPAVACCEVA